MKKLKSTLIIMISVAMIVNTGITALASGNNDYMYRYVMREKYQQEIRW